MWSYQARKPQHDAYDIHSRLYTPYRFPYDITGKPDRGVYPAGRHRHITTHQGLMKKHSNPIIAHLSMFMACAFWGLMAPLGKDAMTHGIDGMDMVAFRVAGGAMLFWLTSLFVRHEHVPVRDIMGFAGAGFLGIVTNQCLYTLGLSITSPVNASIVTTSMPIFAMILSALILKEPITGKKACGVLMGCSGALILILTSAAAVSDKVGDIRGDLLCLGAQFSFALYLSLFNPLIKRYTVFTTNKWMFLWASVFIIPLSMGHIMETDWPRVPEKTWWEAAYVVFFGTYVGYILTMIGQRTLRPTVVSVYNYVQPIVSVTASLILGIALLKWSQALAVALVFSGVWLVTKSRARADSLPENHTDGSTRTQTPNGSDSTTH